MLAVPLSTVSRFDVYFSQAVIPPDKRDSTFYPLCRSKRCPDWDPVVCDEVMSIALERRNATRILR
ncbi:hypothetical protein B2G88_15335 [Natronolimnobius baerhuensis]|uniref:Uncharacterized protein n=1 Tax=Natronolimnobius baerhuensis TaxID=253108 RepID=A0A202E694_9EURY|nr:hypothetical protein B2G88_15335 [Natronolimnobius baerhuensis]